MQPAKIITKEALMPLADYARARANLRKKIIQYKIARRLALGPHATFYFENYTTMLQQIQEMLYIEKGGDEQLADELTAYNPMIPQGTELTATLMFEINDPVSRAAILRRLTHVETKFYIEIDGSRIFATAENEVERTAADGKTSSVHFLHFAFSDAQIAAFRQAGAQIIVGCTHENYAHMTILPEVSRVALAGDFD